MGLIDNLNKAALEANGKEATAAISSTCEALGVKTEGMSYGEDLASVLMLIAERIGKEYVPVPLGKEGEPLEVGRHYYGKDGRAWMVLGFKPCAYDVIGECEGNINTHLKGRWLSTERPDTQERIDEDKSKKVSDYWGCVGRACVECPAMVDGKKPYERYGISVAIAAACSVAQGYDLALRQAKLDGRA